MVIDGCRSLIATFNFCDKYFTLTRDFGILATDPAVVKQIAQCFEADWAQRDYTRREGSALIRSNRGSRALMCAFIDQVRHNLDVQHPKIVDAVILDRLIDAHSRGVHVRVSCGGKHRISTRDILDTSASLKLVRRDGVKIR